jgi:3-isopropylmalate/(R)-2-methylmalate dehydratase small subunit
MLRVSKAMSSGMRGEIMYLEGKAHKFGKDINTDNIMASKYRAKTLDENELAHHLMEDIRPGFHCQIELGDFIVAGDNFGCGSSREYAPRVIRASGIGGILAKSFARIFFRNAMNLGLPVIICDTDSIDQDDLLFVDLEGGKVANRTSGGVIETVSFPLEFLAVLRKGGIVNYVREHGFPNTELVERLEF